VCDEANKRLIISAYDKTGANPKTAYLSNANGLHLNDGVNLDFDTATGSKIGGSASQKIAFWGAPPIVRPSAYTQTYATADKTHAARTYSTVPDNTGGSVITELPAIAAGTAYAQLDMVRVRNCISTLNSQINKLTADHLDSAQVLNSLINDLRSAGIIG
jgi:hypothetical protein